MNLKHTWRDRRSFGPVVQHEPDGSLRALCTWCAFRVGAACTYVKPSRVLLDPENTPEWCELREDMLRDARAMKGPRANSIGFIDLFHTCLFTAADAARAARFEHGEGQ